MRRLMTLPAVGPETIILPVLNGMKHVDTIIARFGENALVGCVCMVATMIVDGGRIVQLTKLQEMAYGEMSGNPSYGTDGLNEAMRGDAFYARLSQTIEREMW